MKTLLAFAVPVVVFGLLGASVWYVASRLCWLFGLTLHWPMRIGVAAGVIGAGIAMLAAARSASATVGVLNVLGGYLFMFYVFLLLALLGLHAVQLGWSLPGPWSAV